MYRIINSTTGESWEVEKPRYVRRNASGVWVQCLEELAQGVAINGKRFSIMNREPVDDAPQVVLIQAVDAGEKVNEVLRENLVQANDIYQIKSAVLDIYDAIINLYGLDG